MDFVVVGFGLGALGVLLGVVMLGWLAPRAHRAAARAAAPDDAAHDRAVAAQHRGAGQTFLYAGAAMLLATVGGLAGSLDDRTGAFLVTTTATVAAIGILLGGHLHRVRYPVPPRRRTRAAPAPGTALVPGPAPVRATFPLADDTPTVATGAGATTGPDAEHADVAPHVMADPGTQATAVEETAPAPPATDAEPAEDATDAGATSDRLGTVSRP